MIPTANQEDPMADVTAVRISEVEGPYGGAMHRLRAALGVTSFGVQVIDLPPNSGDAYPRHSHDDQEEVFVALKGSGVIEAGDESHELDAETVVRVGPGVPRQVRSGADGLRLLALGGVLAGDYTPPQWSELGGPDPQPQPV
jgi:mannose-6-phosphate isomerase-like protein (cupin superfamily)